MGYSVTTPMKSAKAKRAVLAFLKENYRPVSEFISEPVGKYSETFPDYDPSRFIRTQEGSLDAATGEFSEGDLYNFAYDRGTSKIGFNYSSGAIWPFQLCRWMAVMAGRKRKFKDVGEDAVPYYVYDGYMACPVVVNEDADVTDRNLPYEAVSASGFRAPPDLLLAAERGLPVEESEILTALEELDETEGPDTFMGLTLGQMAKYQLTSTLDAVKFGESCREELERLTRLWESSSR